MRARRAPNCVRPYSSASRAARVADAAPPPLGEHEVREVDLVGVQHADLDVADEPPVAALQMPKLRTGPLVAHDQRHSAIAASPRERSRSRELEAAQLRVVLAGVVRGRVGLPQRSQEDAVAAQDDVVPHELLARRPVR